MKDTAVQTRINKLARKFQAVKKFNAEKLLDNIVDAMAPIGGITGFNVASNQTMTIHNHTALYNLPIRYEEHSNKLSSFGKRSYAFLEKFEDYLINEGTSPRNIEYHMGKKYATKHHDPR